MQTIKFIMFVGIMKKETVQKKLVFVLIACNIILVFLTAPLALTPFLNSGDFWFIAILGIIFPYLVCLHLLFLIGWGFFKSRWFFLSLFTLLSNGQQLSVLCGYHFSSKSTATVVKKKNDAIRIFTWNVARWDAKSKKDRDKRSNRLAMFEAIKKQDADILCFQEFFEPKTNKYFDKNIIVLAQMGYHYYYFSPAYITRGEFMHGMAIFSRLPIIDTGRVSFGKTPHSEGIIYSDIKAGDKTIRVFSIHMESFRMGKNDYWGANGNDGVKGKAKYYGWAVKNAYKLRTVQAEMVRNTIDASPYPPIVCGNLGDIPNSYSYFKVKGGLTDAFLRKGAGIGSTFRFFLPTLRLDYIFTDKKIQLTNFTIPTLRYTDHFPLSIDVVL